MKTARHMTSALLAIVLTLTSVLVATSPAQAASDYDDLLQVTPSLNVYTDGSAKINTMDISATWWTDLQQAYSLRITQNIGWPANFISEFSSIISSGGSWGVFTTETESGNVVSIIGTHDPDASCSFATVWGVDSFHCTASSNDFDYLSATYFTHRSYGNNGCGNGWYWYCSNDGMSIYAAPTMYQNGGINWSVANSDLSKYNFYVMNFDVEYPTGYEGAVLPGYDTLEYVAMGDSFSSGEGVEPFFSGTDTGSPSENRCHRSENAYPVLLQEDFTMKLDLTAFVACSGATTNNITTAGQWGEQAQVNALSESTDIVTITIGGNDIGFKEFATACLSPVNGECDEFTDIYDETMGRIATLGPDMESTLNAVLDAAPNADVYVVGYPHIAPHLQYIYDEDTDCTALFQPFLNPWGNGRAARTIVDALNDVIEDAVDDIRTTTTTTRLIYVDTENGPFYGHDTCANDGQGFFNGIDYINQEYTAHPNAAGQVAFKEELAELMQ